MVISSPLVVSIPYEHLELLYIEVLFLSIMLESPTSNLRKPFGGGVHGQD